VALLNLSKKTIKEHDEQKEAQKSFMSEFFTLPKAKIKVTKYDKKSPNLWKLWLWPWAKTAYSCPLRIVSVNYTFEENPPMNVGNIRQTKIVNSNILKPSSVTLTLRQNGWIMLDAHRLNKWNIWAKFYEHSLKNVGHREQTRNAGSST